MPLNTRPATVGDGALLTVYNRTRAGYIVAVSPAGLRVRVHYLSNATRGRTDERWESVDKVLLAEGRRACAHCDAAPTRIYTANHRGAVPQLVCERHGRTDSPRLPRRPAAIA